MNTIEKFVGTELIIKKSRFIGLLYPISSIDDVSLILLDVEERYKNASHYCFAFRTLSNERCSDDGEPSQTAGKPILQILQTSDLTNVLCIVVRYFGGIKLGTGGLIRAYMKVTKECVLEASMKALILGVYFRITFSYDEIKKIDYILNGEDVVNKEYQEVVCYYIKTSKQNFSELSNSLSNSILSIDIQKEDFL